MFIGVLIGFLANGKTRYHDTTAVRHSAVGIYIGGNNTFNSYSGPSESMKLYDLNLDIGAFGTFDLSDKWQIEFGLESLTYGAKYFKYGEKWQSHDTFFNNSAILSGLSYVSVPVIFKLRISDRSTALFGARISALVDYNGKLNDFYTVGNVTNNNNPNIQIPFDGEFSTDFHNYNKSDAGIILGYQYKISSRLFAALILNVNFIPLFPNNGLAFYTASRSDGYYDPVQLGNYNNSLSLRLGYNILMK